MTNNQLKVKMKRQARQRRTRLKIRNSLARPRLAVHRTSKHMYAQVIDDATHRTLVSSSTMSKEFRAVEPRLKGKKAAEWVGKDIAEKAKAAGVTTAVLDRGQYLYHGRIKALADAARGNGLIL